MITPQDRPGWLLEAMLQRTGFEIEEAGYSTDHIFASYIARAV